MRIQIYLLDVSGFQQDVAVEGPEFRHLCERLSEKRQQKIESFRYAKGKALSLGAGLLLDYGLFQYGIRERDVVMVYGPDEKPYLRDYPEIHFNLSHSGTLAMAVFADWEVGCDIERIAVPDMRIAHRFFAVGEIAALESGKEEEQTENFYRFWTLKESFLKLTGKGMRMPMNAFCIHLGPPVYAERNKERLKYGFAEFAYPGYRAALCVEKPGAEVLAGMEPEWLSWNHIWKMEDRKE
ncbi:MAG: 4'-phosphopantetheinyl transferase superfamily protein [Lachnospiraceae bacterium]|jgi:4'-phosphopantetheinyl transferase|nr:4'-phosphopantetheinyl transferase superfamily protein [Lachnospiraceae bacterium]